MNRSESKYFSTALLMDEALIDLLETKDPEYITVKEICKKAGVNRSTFYLHYDTIADLINEVVDVVNKRFQSYFKDNAEKFSRGIENMRLEELIFINQDYLQPYLQFIKDNKKIYRAAFRNPYVMQAQKRYKYLKEYILDPILNRFAVPIEFRKYYISYYIEGIMAIIKEWLSGDCKEAINDIITIIEKCVNPNVIPDKE